MCATISASFTLSHRLFEDQSEHDECFCRNNGRANGLREYVPESDVFDKYIEKDGIDPQVYKCNGKVERELHKILGTLSAGAIQSHPAVVSATCTRANVMEGHTEAVFASLARRASLDEVRAALRDCRNEARELKLPSAPEEWIHVHEDPFRPQPRLDRNRGGGMTTTVGRVREDKVLRNGVKYLLVTHNTRMGAAAGAVLVAEYLKVRGFLGT